MSLILIPTDVSAPESGLLRLLLSDPRLDPDDLDWSALLPLAEQCGVLLRLADWFQQRGEAVPVCAEPAIARARAQQGALLATASSVAARGFEHVFLTLAQQYPDIEPQVELLVGAGEQEAFDGMPELTVTVHRGQLVRLGGHHRYARQLLQRRRRVTLGDVSLFAPSAEDALILAALRLRHERPALAMRDALWTITTLRDTNLDWDYLLRSARQVGLRTGLKRLLDDADRIHRRLLGLPLIQREARAGRSFGPGPRAGYIRPVQLLEGGR